MTEIKACGAVSEEFFERVAPRSETHVGRMFQKFESSMAPSSLHSVLWDCICRTPVSKWLARFASTLAHHASEPDA